MRANDEEARAKDKIVDRERRGGRDDRRRFPRDQRMPQIPAERSEYGEGRPVICSDDESDPASSPIDDE